MGTGNRRKTRDGGWEGGCMLSQPQCDAFRDCEMQESLKVKARGDMKGGLVPPF